MVVPTVFIFLPFLVAFVMAVCQYMAIDPRRRILNQRFALMAGAVVAVFYYIFHAHARPDDRLTSWIFLGLAVAWVIWAWFLSRRMPPRENY